MRVNAVILSALYSSATFLGQARAEDDDAAADSTSTSVTESSTSSALERPTFTVSNKKVALGQLWLYLHC